MWYAKTMSAMSFIHARNISLIEDPQDDHQSDQIRKDKKTSLLMEERLTKRLDEMVILCRENIFSSFF